MKSAAWTILLCGVLLVAAGCARQTGEAQMIGIVDISRVFQESQAGMQGMEYLQSINEEFQKEFERLQSESEEDTNANAQKLQQAIAQYQAVIGREQERVVTLLNEEFRSVIETFRQDNNYSILLSQENVLAAGEGVDVTDRIIQEFDKVQIDLDADAARPSVQEQTPPAPAEEQNATE
jgi:outer membrane protein